jgi:hypothetical protein
LTKQYKLANIILRILTKTKNMSETLPNPQQESKFWQEKLELHKNAARLNGAESAKILGSSLAEKRSDYDEMYTADTINDYSFESETRKIDGALAELAGLQVSSEDTQLEFGADLVSLAISLKREQESLPFGTANHQELADRRAAVAYLLAQYEDDIQTPQQQLEKSVKPSEFREAIRDWTNQTIEAHNSRIESAENEAVVNNADVRAAQERINNRYEEYEIPSKSSGSVDDARKKVAEVFGDTIESERQVLIAEVVRAAQDATRIHTDIPKGVQLKSAEGDYRPIDGFNSFGDGLSQNNQHHSKKLTYSGSAEAFMFAPDTTTRYKTVTKTIETGGLFKKKTEQIDEQVPDGEMLTMVLNPATGQQEPGVKVAYQFNGNQRRENNQTMFYEGPEYKTESGRGGNQLFVEATLPKSVAEKLRQAASRDPEIAREFAEVLTLNNGISEQVWNSGVRPPFDQIPDGWEMTITELEKDTRSGDARYEVKSAKPIKLGR